MSEAVTPITVTVKRACQLSGLSTSSVYRLFESGHLTRIRVGGRTLIKMSELQKVLEGQAEAA